jgi:hypothetical protein
MFLEGQSADDWDAIGRDRLTGSAFFAPLEDVADVRLTSLRSALSKSVQAGLSGGGWDSSIELPRQASFILAVTPDGFDAKYSPMRDYFFDLDNERLLVCVELDLSSEAWTRETMRSAVQPLLVRIDCTFIDCDEYGGGPTSGLPWRWSVRFEPPMRSTTVSRACELAESVQRLVAAIDGSDLKLDAEAAWELLSAGQATALYGQPESDWLEAKTFGWDLSTDAGKIELAQDVARFGNGEQDAVIIVGMATSKVSGTEVLVRGPGQTFNARVAQRHHQVLDQRMFPPVEGLRVEALADQHDGQLLCLFIPRQPEELKPFLVQGVIVGEKVEGAFISIVRRRGEHSIAVSPAALHAQIAAGRALLRGTGPR